MSVDDNKYFKLVHEMKKNLDSAEEDGKVGIIFTRNKGKITFEMIQNSRGNMTAIEEEGEKTHA